MGCFGISCREKIEVVESPPPAPLGPCGPPPPCAPQKALRWGRAKIPESATPRPPANHRATRLEPTSPDFSPDSPAQSAAEREFEQYVEMCECRRGRLGRKSLARSHIR